MLKTNYVVEGREIIEKVNRKEKMHIVDDRAKFATLKSILKAHWKNDSIFSVFDHDNVVGCSEVHRELSKTAALDVFSYYEEKYLLSARTATITISIRFIECGQEKIFAEVIHMDEEMIKSFKTFIRGFRMMLETKDRRVYNELPDKKKGGKIPAAKKVVGEFREI